MYTYNSDPHGILLIPIQILVYNSLYPLRFYINFKGFTTPRSGDVIHTVHSPHSYEKNISMF